MPHNGMTFQKQLIEHVSFVMFDVISQKRESVNKMTNMENDGNLPSFLTLS